MSNETKLQTAIEEIIRSENLVSANIYTENVKKGGYLSLGQCIIIEEGSDKSGKKVLNLYLKSIPKDDILRNGTPVVECFNVEIAMYTKILPTLLKFQEEKHVSHPFLSVAKCYETCSSEREEFLILEDLSHAGYVLWDKTKPLNDDILEMVLKEYARFHALSLAYKSQMPEEFEKLRKLIPEDVITKFMRLNLTRFTENIKDGINVLDPDKDNDAIEALTKLVATKEIENLLTQITEDITEAAVILHGDCWCNNFMFLFDDIEDKSKPLKMKLLDWQVAKVGCPILDICYCFYTNCSQEALENLEKYLRIYYECLISSVQELGSDLGNIFPFSEFQKYWKKFAKFGIIVASSGLKACYAHADEIPEVKIEKADEFLDSITESKPVGTNFSKYKRRITGIMLHFIQNDLL